MCRTTCAFVVTLIAVSVPARAQIIDVPYVPQSEELCGGAAVAMVMRYWDSPPIYAEDFTPLVGKSAGLPGRSSPLNSGRAKAGGISIGVLARAVRERGWRAHSFTGTAADVQGHLSHARPVIALIEDTPGRLHYVVIVAWTDDRVVFHDPAVSAHRTFDVARFHRAWQVTGRTALLVLPPDNDRSPAVHIDDGDTAREQSLPRRSASDPRAEVGLPRQRASDLRAKAGTSFLQKRWRDAANLAQLVVDADPHDLEAWQLLAASRFLDGDAAAALAAWNRRGEPRVDLARIEGLRRTRYAVVAGLLGLPSQSLLTEHDLRRAARRIADLPSAQLTRVSYSPREDGTGAIDVAIVERPLVPRSRTELAAAAIYAATAREARLRVASPSGNGELWTVATRWWSGRPRLAIALETARLGPWTGRWRVEGTWEQQTYRVDASVVETDRRHAGVAFSDWISGDVRWEITAAFDRWPAFARSNRSDLRRGRPLSHHVSIGAATERRLLADRLAVRAEGSVSPSIGKAPGFGTARVSSRWRSSTETFAAWTAAAGVSTVTAHTPIDFWPAGDTGVVRSTLVRAHPLLDRGEIDASRLRRVLAHGTLEFQHPVVVRPFAQIGWAAFVDGAGKQIDAGAGLRVKLPGAPGLLRIDFARGLRDGAAALSMAWTPAW